MSKKIIILAGIVLFVIVIIMFSGLCYLHNLQKHIYSIPRDIVSETKEKINDYLTNDKTDRKTAIYSEFSLNMPRRVLIVFVGVKNIKNQSSSYTLNINLSKTPAENVKIDISNWFTYSIEPYLLFQQGEASTKAIRLNPPLNSGLPNGYYFFDFNILDDSNGNIYDSRTIKVTIEESNNIKIENTDHEKLTINFEKNNNLFDYTFGFMDYFNIC